MKRPFFIDYGPKTLDLTDTKTGEQKPLVNGSAFDFIK